MNGFERHHVAHLSPSSINLFARQPALWVMEKLLKKRGSVGAAAHRGTSAETGIVHGLLNPTADVAVCQDIAARDFDRLAALSGDPRKDRERGAVPGIVSAALPELRAYGVPDGVQVRIDRTIPGIPVPFLGYIDVQWSQHAITLDIKSQLRLSSEISPDHARQVSIYVHGTNHEGRIAYCTPSKIGVYRLENVAQHIADVVVIAGVMERFLSLSDDPHVLAGLVVPDLTSFYFADPMTAAIAREVFGFASPSAQAAERSPAAPTAGILQQGDF